MTLALNHLPQLSGNKKILIEYESPAIAGLF